MFKFLFLTFLSFSAYTQATMTPKEGLLMKSEGLRLWQNRDLKEDLESALSKFELAHQGDPNDLETVVFLIQGNFILADAHTSDNEAKKKLLEKGKDFGMEGLRTNEEFKKLVDKKGEDVEDAVKVLTEKETAVAYWTAASLGLWAKANGIFSSIKYKDQIVELIRKVEMLDPKYFHGAVPRYWGSYYSAIPSIAGKDLKKSKKYYEESLALAPEYLGTKVLMAEIYAVEKDDKALFKKLLLEVLADKSNHPELGPENRIERKKAEKLLEQADELF
jgi:tetratricopeptide (TPR) repeat protein